MNPPTYHKKIAIYLQDRDFYGFLEEEGEAYIEGLNLVVDLRFNNRMTSEKGNYIKKIYPILEYFEDSKLLKVFYRDSIPAIFDMNTAKLHYYGTEYLRLIKDDYNFLDLNQVRYGFGFLAHHLCYLYRMEPQAALDLMPTIFEWGNGTAINLGKLQVYKENWNYYIHQEGSPFLVQVSAHQKGITFNYPYISYYFEGLKKYLEDSLKDMEWMIT
jgi:hypothetical protein